MRTVHSKPRASAGICLANYLVQNWEWSKEPKWTKFVDWTDSSSRKCTRSRPVIFAARHTDTSKIHQGYAQGRVPPSRTFVRHFVLDSAEEQCCELKGAPSPTSSSPSWNMTERLISFVSPVEFVQTPRVNAAYSKVLLCPSNASYMMKGRSVPFTNASTSARTTLGGTLEVFEQGLAHWSSRRTY